jgi:hypothetical protein
MSWYYWSCNVVKIGVMSIILENRYLCSNYEFIFNQKVQIMTQHYKNILSSKTSAQGISLVAFQPQNIGN